MVVEVKVVMVVYRCWLGRVLNVNAIRAIWVVKAMECSP